MKKYIFILLGISFFLGVIMLLIGEDIPRSDVPTSRIFIQPIHTIRLLYFPEGITARELRIQYPDAKAVVNGGYFGYSLDKSFVPAGKFILEGIDKTYFPATNNDQNLAMFIYSDGQNISFSDTFPNQIVLSGFVFQAGPVLIRSGEIHTKLGQDYSHWNKSFLRTFLLYDGISYHIGVMSYATTLSALAMALSSSCKTKNCVAVNLDGGPSTSMIMNSSGVVVRVNSDEKLPLWFIVDQK